MEGNARISLVELEKGLELIQDAKGRVGEMEEREEEEGVNEDVAVESTGTQSSDASHVVVAAEPAMSAYMQFFMAEFKKLSNDMNK